MEYAYSVLNVKDASDSPDVLRISGIATTPTPDRMNDVVVPEGARFKIPMPLLWQHDHQQPVGNITFAKTTKNGIPFNAEIPKVPEAGRLKDRIDEAIQSIKYKLINAVSIGFAPNWEETEILDNGGLKFNSWEWLELSLVTVPANAEAVITAVKSIDDSHRAAFGTVGAMSADRDAFIKRHTAAPSGEGKRVFKVVSLKSYHRSKT